MFREKNQKNILQIKSLIKIVAGLLIGAALAVAALGGSDSTSVSQGDMCRTTVAVGVVKSEKADANSVVSSLAGKLTNTTQVKVVPVTSPAIPSEADFRAQAARLNPDYLLRLEVVKSLTDGSAQVLNRICGYGIGRSCGAKAKILYKIKYILEEAASGKVVKNGEIEQASSDEQKVLGEVADAFSKQIGGLLNDRSRESTSINDLYRKHLCYAGFPRNPASLIMKYDVTTAGKKVAYDYFIKGPLWRVSIRPLGGAAPYIIGYNGSQIWTLNKSEGVSVFTPSEETRANRVGFLMGEFLSEADSENLKYEFVSSSIVGKEVVNGKDCQIVESVSRADTFVRFSYDARTGALMKKVILDENKKIESETTFDDYREVLQGTRFPFRVHSKSSEGEANIVFVEVMLNPEISDDKFLKPA